MLSSIPDHQTLRSLMKEKTLTALDLNEREGVTCFWVIPCQITQNPEPPTPFGLGLASFCHQMCKIH